MPTRCIWLFLAKAHKPAEPTPQPTSRMLCPFLIGTAAARKTVSSDAWKPIRGCNSRTRPRSRVVSITSVELSFVFYIVLLVVEQARVFQQVEGVVDIIF